LKLNSKEFLQKSDVKIFEKMSNSYFLKTTLIRKIFMSLTGLFLSFFLVIHLAGNFQLLLPEEVASIQYNVYSHILSGNIIIKVVSYVLYLSILFHIIDSIIITLMNRKSSGTNYKYDKRGQVSSWVSRNMFPLGLLIFLFLVLHLKDFWYIYKFGQTPMDVEGNKDLFAIVVAAYQELWIVIVYVISMIILGLHLWHGFYSAFRTLGLYHYKYSKWLKYFGMFFSIAISLGFAIIPIIIYLKYV